MVGELAIGLIAIAVAIGLGLGLGLLPIWYILRRDYRTSQKIQEEIKTIRPLLTDMMTSGIDGRKLKI